MSRLTRLKTLFLDFLFPGSAAAARLRALSPEEMLREIPPAATADTEALALWSYRAPLAKALVWEVKFNADRSLARPVGLLLYDLIMSELLEREWLRHPVILAPVPMSDERLLERGWNQCEILAEAVLAHDAAGHLSYVPKLLRRRHAAAQLGASRAERLENLRGTMSVEGSRPLKDAVVILLDDVVTTGATFAEAKRALREAGARRVLCVALAH